MCGIAGVVSPDKTLSRAVLHQMTNSISHRGPDGEGHWVHSNGQIGFGHRRLAVLDLSDEGRQPMHYADGRYTVVFNGEIYNYLELRSTLKKRGYTFASHSDTEVLLASFQDQQEDCLSQLDGMFAFAIWDNAKHRLFCARDRFGEKPFYYAIHDGALFFASEMKALWAAGVPREVSDSMLFRFLARGQLRNQDDLAETFFSNIFQLKPAHCFSISAQDLEVKQRKYWSIDHEAVNHDITEDDAAERFRELFNQSVAMRLRSDVPVGSSLSGGLDSSLIVCTIDAIRNEPRHPQATFSATFPGFAKDERKYMQYVIDQTNVTPHFVAPDASRMVDDWETMVYHQEEPFGSASIYAQFCVMRLAKAAGVTVLLDGQGADELLAGYPFYFRHFHAELRSTNRSLWKSEREHHARIHGGAASSRTTTAKNVVKRFIPESILLRRSANLEKKMLAGFVDREFLETHFERSCRSRVSGRQAGLAQSLCRSCFEGGLVELLQYADRNSMAFSREVRLPFLSHQLTEFLFSLPSTMKIKEGVTKYIMRRAFADLLPPDICNRQDKIGYEPPQDRWLESPRMRELHHQSNRSLIDRGYLVDRNETRQFDPDNRVPVWRTLMLGSFLNAN